MTEPLNRTNASMLARFFDTCFRHGVMDSCALEDNYTVRSFAERHDGHCSFGVVGDDLNYDWKMFLDGKKTSDVYEEFRAWATAEGYQSPLVRKQFTDRCCKESGAVARKSHGNRFYCFPGA